MRKRPDSPYCGFTVEEIDLAICFLTKATALKCQACPESQKLWGKKFGDDKIKVTKKNIQLFQDAGLHLGAWIRLYVFNQQVWLYEGYDHNAPERLVRTLKSWIMYKATQKR